MQLFKALNRSINRFFTSDAYFHEAISKGRIESVAEVIGLGFNLDNYYNNITPLQCSLLYHQAECIALLLDNGADPNLFFKTSYYAKKALQFSIERHGKSEVKILALYGANLVDITFTSSNQHLQELIQEKLKDCNKRKELEQRLQESTNIAEKIKAHTLLSQLWAMQCLNEESVVYRNHYLKKSQYHHSKAEQLTQESKIESKPSSILTEEDERIPLLEHSATEEISTKLKKH